MKTSVHTYINLGSPFNRQQWKLVNSGNSEADGTGLSAFLPVWYHPNENHSPTVWYNILGLQSIGK